MACIVYAKKIRDNNEVNYEQWRDRPLRGNRQNP